MLDLAEKPRLAVLSGRWDYAGKSLAGSGQEGGSRCAWNVPDHYMLQCRLQLDPKAEFTLTMRQTEEPNSGYRLSLRPEKQEAEIAGAAFRESRRIRLDASQPVAIQAFVQGSMIETFINDQYALSCRAYDFPTGKLVLGVRGSGSKGLGVASESVRAGQREPLAWIIHGPILTRSASEGRACDLPSLALRVGIGQCVTGILGP